MKIGKTSSEIKNRWNAKTYKRYTVNLRKDEDAELMLKYSFVHVLQVRINADFSYIVKQ